jgi:hypothetical protein
MSVRSGASAAAGRRGTAAGGDAPIGSLVTNIVVAVLVWPDILVATTPLVSIRKCVFLEEIR